MADFFKGWRRKAGCVLLVMALLFAGAWTRSLALSNSLTIPVAAHTAETWVSMDGRLFWCAESEYEPPYNWYQGDCVTLEEFITRGVITLDWEWLGFASGRWNGDQFMAISYGSVVIPLTLLSVFLILWPGNRPERKPTAPT